MNYLIWNKSKKDREKKEKKKKIAREIVCLMRLAFAMEVFFGTKLHWLKNHSYWTKHWKDDILNFY